MSAQNTSTDHVSPLDETATTNAQPRRQVNWSLWLQWTLATGLGWIVGAILHSLVLHLVETTLGVTLGTLAVRTSGLLEGILFALPIATSFGFMQALVLKKHGCSIIRFTWASALGGILGGVLSVLAAFAIFFCASGAAAAAAFWLWLTAAGAITGGLVGRLQDGVLFRQRWSGSKWARTNAFAWSISCALLGLLAMLRSQNLSLLDQVVFVFLMYAACGLTGGAITGIRLVRMLPQSPIQNQKSEIQNELTSSHLG